MVSIVYTFGTGANNYNENNISKATYTDRIEWVHKNIDNILRMDKVFLNKAENRFVFAAFCLNMRELHLNSQFEVKLPIFLDATCSGIQHLAGLMQDIVLASKVNLIFSKNPLKAETGPSDIYNELRGPINDEIRKTGLIYPEYRSLNYVNLTRKMVKTPIMTRTYNVTRSGIRDQLMSNFEKIESKIKDVPTKWIVPSIIPGENGAPLTFKDINKIAEIIYDTIFKEYPTLSFIYNYFGS